LLDRTDGKSLRSGFLRHAELTPDAPAIVVRGATRSYGELQQNAARWANAVLGASHSQPQRIGVFAYRSEVSYTGTLAALFTGAAFVPLNPTFPPEKTRAMIVQAALDAIIVDKTCAAQLSSVLAGISVPLLLTPELSAPRFDDVDVPILDAEELRQTAVLGKLPPLTAEDIAYLLFTSGSTGAPKGVPVTHGNAVHFMNVMSQRYDITSNDRFSQTFDQTFDLSVFDLFMAWSNGACVYSLSTIELLAPTKFINRNELTVWFSVPSLPAQMIRRNTLTPASMPTLRWSLFCGEPLPVRTAQLWQQAAPNSVVENQYGPTELTIACFVHRWNPEESPALCQNDVVPIGRPYPGLGAMLVDENLNPVPDGEPGELCVTGAQTSPGYWHDDAKTAERFVNLPISPYETRRFYRTGDRVVRLEGGEYIFLGRADYQIKVLGHRVELGEVEAALRQHPSVEHAVAVGWPLNQLSADAVLAFVSGNGVDETILIEKAKEILPPYAVPQKLFFVDQMPLNANGKIDRRALQEQLGDFKLETAKR
jgi:amino acid adenylation domain-containing protein